MFKSFKIYILILIFALVFSIPTSNVNDNNKIETTKLSNNLEEHIDVAETDEIDESLIKTTINSKSRLFNTEVASPFKQEELLNFRVTSYGGVHKDGYGKKVYSNYAAIDINFLYSYGLITDRPKINDDAYIHYMIDLNIPGETVGTKGTYTLKSHVGYGVLIVSRENGDGSRDDIRPIYLKKNKSTNTIYITEDGNYHFTIYLLTADILNKNQVVTTIDYVVPVRTCCYLKSVRNNMDVKNLVGNKGVYYDDFRIDLMNRKNVTVKVDGNITNDGFIFTIDNIYDIEVYGNGFLSEKFTFERAKNPKKDLIANFSNIRKKVNTYTYEAENNFTVSWRSTHQNLETTYLFNDSKEEKIFTLNQNFTEPGVYVFLFKIPNFRTHIYTIVLENDKVPSHNYSVLSGKRFNNFMSKWYEVYDSLTDVYYCFSIFEYKSAYEAAISLENNKVVKNASQFIYEEHLYSSKYELTNALNKNAKENIKLKYYDLDDDHIEKLFSSKCFEDKIYLNKDFVFVSLHPSESNEVTLKNLETNELTNIDFLRKIEDYNLKSGNYEVIEKDIYGNKTTYEVTYDNSSPDVYIQTDDNDKKVVNDGEDIYCNYFSIKELFDEYDDYSIVSINDEYYLKNEIENAIFSLPGEYSVRAYDRNNNQKSFKVTISEDNKLFGLVEDESNYKINLTDGTSIKKVLFNGNESNLNELTINKYNEKGTYIIYLENNDKKDIIRLNVYDKDKNDNKENTPFLDETVDDKSKKNKMITIISVSVVVGIGLIFMIIEIIVQRKEKDSISEKEEVKKVKKKKSEGGKK